MGDWRKRISTKFYPSPFVRRVLQLPLQVFHDCLLRTSENEVALEILHPSSALNPCSINKKNASRRVAFKRPAALQSSALADSSTRAMEFANFLMPNPTALFTGWTAVSSSATVRRTGTSNRVWARDQKDKCGH